MTRRRLRILAVPAAAVLAAAGLVACGAQGIDLDAGATEQERRGAEIFQQRCAGCHTLAAAGSQGSAVAPNDREYKDGPNFNQRAEEFDQVLYAIQNGGFSSGPMPQNIVVGTEAEAVARFVAEYSGRERPDIPSPASQPE
jgi:mono/diheme cytochrome c family protein